jgi:hypothetical protein
MAIRNDFAPGEVLAAADLNDTFGSKLPYSFGTATPTTTTSGFLWYDSTGAPSKPTPKFWDGSAFVPLGGKILQVVRATDSTQRSTTSTTFVDVTGMSVTITPQKSDSSILIIVNALANSTRTSNNTLSRFVITDSSDNVLGGGPWVLAGTGPVMELPITLITLNTPATTSATTYKLRFRSEAADITTSLQNSNAAGQIYAIEVSA